MPLPRGRMVCALILGALLAVSARPAQAQQWAQEVEIVTSVNSGQATRVFLDSLIAGFKDRDSLRVRREAGGERLTLKELQSQLIEKGVGLFSANRVFIEYGFEIRDNEFIEVIQNLHFVFRPPSSGEQDLSILFVDGSNPVAQTVLTTTGIPNPENLESVALFKDELSFASLSLDQGADIVAVGGAPIRGEFDQRRKAVLQRFKQFVYYRDKVYVTRVR